VKYKLGKKPYKRNPRALLLSRYLIPSTIPKPPQTLEYATGYSNWGMYGNDTVGDCTCVAATHIIAEGEYCNGQPITPTTSTTLEAYAAITGYNPDDPNSDQGAVCSDVLDYWRKTGISNNRLTAYLQVQAGNLQQLYESIALFGNVYCGLNLPYTSQDQFANGQPWSLVADWRTNPDAQPGSLGGHCVPLIGYDQDSFECVTWAKVQKMTKEFWRYYVDEAYVVLGPHWADAKSSPSGFNLAQLQDDLGQITQKVNIC
jgi:hypothetical protein